MASYIARIAERQGLREDEAYNLCVDMLRGAVDPIEISAILMGLRVKGEEPQEIRGFVRALRDNAVKVRVGDAMDIVGTGGDGLNTINASTLASIVVASIGVPVAKHGNRGFSSLVGSADFMEALGYPIEHGADVAEELLRLEGYAYLYAPKYHQALKAVAPVRKRLGIRTIFNLAAPLANPANPKIQVIGVPSPNMVKLIYRAVEEIDLRRFAVITGHPGMDELSPSGPSIAIIKRGSVEEITISPKTLGLEEIPINHISGQTREEIIEKGVRGLRGEDKGLTSFIAINAGLALYVAGEAGSIEEGYEKAYREIVSGSAWRKLGRIVATARRLAGLGSG
ncbi:MAG: anthranilate phosphoribosyltransferase [Sulfolobales archaeon]